MLCFPGFPSKIISDLELQVVDVIVPGPKKEESDPNLSEEGIC